MKHVVNGQWSVISFRKVGVYCLLAAAYCLLACSIPSLEKPECTQARDAVKGLYSFHFGAEKASEAENLKGQKRFLTNELFTTLSASVGMSQDYFTKSVEFPKTFKIGKCVAPEPDKANVQVQLYWRDDTKTVQKEVNVEAVAKDGSWLINKVSQ